MAPELTKNAFDGLLHELDPDRETAARKLEVIRGRVRMLFISRGCGHPDECTARTLDRVASHVANNKEIETEDITRYCIGVARKVHLEYLRNNKREAKHRQELKEYLLTQELHGDGATEELIALERRKTKCQRMCLQRLPEETLDLLNRYLKSNKKEKEEIAREQSRTSNALRIEIHRIKKSLRECYQKCLKQLRDEI